MGQPIGVLGQYSNNSGLLRCGRLKNTTLGDRPMLLLTLLAFGGATMLTSSLWIFGRLDQENKALFVELLDDNKF